ncbi:hypothetical protein Aduo_013673 [Ancylostoma duodenale]
MNDGGYFLEDWDDWDGVTPLPGEVPPGSTTICMDNKWLAIFQNNTTGEWNYASLEFPQQGQDFKNEVIRIPHTTFTCLRAASATILHSSELKTKNELKSHRTRFKSKNPEDPNEVPGGFLTDINKDSLTVLYTVLIDKSIAHSKVYDRYQFERVGYFSVDPDTVPGKETKKGSGIGKTGMATEFKNCDTLHNSVRKLQQLGTGISRLSPIPVPVVTRLRATTP